MRDRKVATRYAEALLISAKAEGVLLEVAESFAAVMEITADNRDLLIFMHSPQVRTEEKKELLKTVFGAKVETVLLNFFYLLVDRNRIENVQDIGEVFADLVEQDQNIVRALVTTAIALPDDLAASLKTKLVAYTGADVILEKKTDPAVLGGVCVKIGNRVLDGTVRTNLAQLGKQLGAARVH